MSCSDSNPTTPELLLHQETLKKQLAFKNDQLKQFQAAVEECNKLLAQSPPAKSDVTMPE